MSFIVVDSFTPHAARVRESVLAAGVGTWRPNKGEVGSSVYDGMAFYGEHAPMMTALVRAMGQPLVPNSMFFRVTNENTEAAYIHSDREAGDFTAIAYLSEHDGQEYGTGFYRNKRNGATVMPTFEELRANPEEFALLKDEMTEGSDEDWERIDFVRGVFNRALIFDAPLYHARIPRHGFGTTPEAGRLIWCCHFVTLSAAEGKFYG